MIIEGFFLKDLKKNLLTARSLEFQMIKDHPVLIITPEDGEIKMMVTIKFPKIDEKDIA